MFVPLTHEEFCSIRFLSAPILGDKFICRQAFWEVFSDVPPALSRPHTLPACYFFFQGTVFPWHCFSMAMCL